MSDELLERLRSLAGGVELLELAAGHQDVDLVGGAVRDLLLANTPRELDVVVGDDVSNLAQELAARLQTQAKFHDRFGTATIEQGEVRIDLATRRAESYPFPGALPQVRPGDREEDLNRRDFTINAISLSLAGTGVGELHAVGGALEDLKQRRLRVLHERSFLDDPTRLWRLGRYATRLHFNVEEHTAELAVKAIAHGALETISGARIGAELRLALAEPDPVATLSQLEELGVLTALHARLRVDEPLIRRALELLPEDGNAQLLILASITLPLVLRVQDDPRIEIVSLLDRLEFPRSERELVVGAAVAVPRLLGELGGAASNSELYNAASHAPLEGIVLAGALMSAGPTPPNAVMSDPVGHWLQRTRHVRLELSGEDLLDAGVPAGPEIGARLKAALHMRLDEEIEPGKDAELRAALAARI